MTNRHGRTLALVAIFIARAAGGQQLPAIRPIGAVERFTTDSLASVSAALAMPGGRVMVNDISSRRVLLFDSTLAHAVIVADTTSATADAYGARTGTLIRYRPDTALFIDPASLSMLVIGPTGAILRVMAIPRPDEAQFLIGSIFGTPGFDARGRLVYYVGEPGSSFFVLAPGSRVILDPKTGKLPALRAGTDSAPVVRVDLTTRLFDTVAIVKIPRTKSGINADAQGNVTSTVTVHDPIPIVDDWAVCADGSIAVVRGRDLHVDWLNAEGVWRSEPKVPFDWQHLDEAHKLALVDSAARDEQAARDSAAARRAAMLGRANSTAQGVGAAGGNGSRGGGRGAGGRGGVEPLPTLSGRADPNEVSDYLPAFKRGSVQCDVDGRLWIRTTTMVSGQPVYDIVNRRGELVDRVQLPPFRTIAGFGPGVVYLGVKDASGVVHMERAKIR